LLARGGLYARLYELQYQSQDRFGASAEHKGNSAPL
jgi:hypothetical protein